MANGKKKPSIYQTKLYIDDWFLAHLVQLRSHLIYFKLQTHPLWELRQWNLKEETGILNIQIYLVAQEMPPLGQWSPGLLGYDVHFLPDSILPFSQEFSYDLLWVSLHVWLGMWSGKRKHVRDKWDQLSLLSMAVGIGGFKNNQSCATVKFFPSV